MNMNLVKLIIAAAILIMSSIACNDGTIAAGGHSVKVNIGSNGCGVVACTNKPNQTGIIIK